MSIGGSTVCLGGIARHCRLCQRLRGSNQLPGARDIRFAAGAGEQPVVADAVKSPGQDVEQEAPDELVRGERDRAIPRLPVAAVFRVVKGYASFVEADQPAVRYGDAVGIAGEVDEHRLGPGEGRLGIDEPVLPPQRREVRREGWAM